MKNRYAKKCCWCGVMVQPFDGKAWNYNGRWYFVGFENNEEYSGKFNM